MSGMDDAHLGAVKKQKTMTTMEKMNTNKKTTELIDRKVLLSSLWLFAMLTYTYGDAVT
jgi:hypothetical protein